MRESIFISIANQAFKSFRADLRDTLVADFDVVVQPDFPATACDTIQKLDDLIAPCQLLIHLVSIEEGSTAHAEAVSDFFNDIKGAISREAFLTRWPKARARLGDFSELTYAN